MLDEPDLRVELRVGGDDDEVIDGVEAEADGVELTVLAKRERETQSVPVSSSVGGPWRAPGRGLTTMGSK
jgi:hypothetical protein